MLSNILSKTFPKTLLYFFPKSNTPGCTLESRDFSRLRQEFENIGIEIVGISRDDSEVQNRFCEKNNLEIRMVSDKNEDIHNFFDVMGEKTLFGKVRKTVIRSTFLLDSKSGNIIKAWRNVRSIGHAQKILDEMGE